MKREIPLAILASLLVPNVAWSHGFAIYVSTPITPPATFEWTPIVSTISILVASFLSYWLIARKPLVDSFLTSLGATSLFWLVLVFIGGLAAMRTTAPPPGLGLPSAIYWHWRSGELEGLFIMWNALGVAILTAAVVVFGRLWRIELRRRCLVLVIPALVYLACLSPFLVSGAIAHGWGGGYVTDAGLEQLRDVNRACFLYAADHDGLLPVAKNIDDLMPQIEDYLQRRRSRYGNPVTIHPAAWAFEKEPQAYIWNPALSGRPAPSLPIVDANQLPVQCPYIGNHVPLIDDLDESQSR
jgi:hypothetical protein